MTAPPTLRTISPRLAAFVIAAVLVYATHSVHDIRLYPYDALLYWRHALLPETLLPHEYIRGYLFAALLRGGVRAFVALGMDPVPAFRVLSSLVYAGILAVLIPSAFLRLFGGNDSLLRRLAPAALVLLVCPGLVVYPLSDLPALGCVFGSIYLAADPRPGAAPSGKIPLWLRLLLSGAVAAAAYNIRSIYLFTLLPLLLVVVWRHRRSPGLIVAFCLGALLVTVPQVLINKKIHGVYSANPAISIGSLFAAQLSLGLTVQKAETALPPRAPANVRYLDPEAPALFARLGREPEIRSVRDYALLVAAQPLHFAWLYVRHFVNGLDVRDGLVYVDTRPEQMRWLSYFNFAVLLLAGLIALQGAMRKEAAGDPVRADRYLYAAVILLPVAAIVPSAVETRYFLPLHMLAYACVAMKFDLRGIRTVTRSQWVIHAIVAILAASAFFAISQATIANLQQPAAVSP